jgi:phytoene synthase
MVRATLADGAGECCGGGAGGGVAAAIRARIDDVCRGELDLPLPEFRDRTQHVMAAMVETVRRHGILRQDLFDFLDACADDAAVVRYATWTSLRKHCRGVGGMAAVIASAVLGLQHSDAREPAIRIGEGVRLTQILCRLKADATAGRVYVPLEDLARFRFSDREMIGGVANENLRELVRFEVARARELLRDGAAAIGWVAGDGSRVAAASVVEACRATLDQIERHGVDVMARPPQFMTARAALARLTRAFRLARREPGDAAMEAVTEKAAVVVAEGR